MTTAHIDDPGRTRTGVPDLARSTPVQDRALAPDLARGMMLLLIALAHVPWFLYDEPTGLALLHPLGGNLADQIAQALTLIVVDGRTHTMFGFLFAYGIGQMYTRQTDRGTSERVARRLLRTRHLWLLLFGAVHALLLWQGDILGTYGLIGLIMVPLFFRRSDRTLKIWLVVFLVIGLGFVLLGALATLAGPAAPPPVNAADVQRLSMAEPSYLLSALIRFPTWLFGLGSGLLTLALPTAFLMGTLAARHRILDQPGRHLPLLRRTAVLGIGLGWAAGLALALSHLGVADLGDTALLASVHFYTGIFAGVGYAAAFGLLAHRISGRRAEQLLGVRALLALGRRSLSGYLAQSLIFIWPLAAWGLALGPRLSSWSAAAVAVGAWLLTLLGALLLERADRRGPAEVLLRRLTYRRPAPHPPGGGDGTATSRVG